MSHMNDIHNIKEREKTRERERKRERVTSEMTVIFI